MRLFRSAFLLALASCALSAHAAETVYDFHSPYAKFTLVTSEPVTTNTSFYTKYASGNPPQPAGSYFKFLNSHGELGSITSVTFSKEPAFGGFQDVLDVEFAVGSHIDFRFADGTFVTPGVYRDQGTFGGQGATFLSVITTPGPSAALPFALMALRRRKRA